MEYSLVPLHAFVLKMSLILNSCFTQIFEMCILSNLDGLQITLVLGYGYLCVIEAYIPIYTHISIYTFFSFPKTSENFSG